MEAWKINVIEIQNSMRNWSRSLVKQEEPRGMSGHSTCWFCTRNVLIWGWAVLKRLCLEDKSAGSAELYTKMVPQHGQRGEPRGTPGRSKCCSLQQEVLIWAWAVLIFKDYARKIKVLEMQNCTRKWCRRVVKRRSQEERQEGENLDFAPIKC